MPLSDLRVYLRGSPTSSICHTFRLGYDTAVTSDGSGIINAVFSNVPTGAQNWSSYASVFDEYRVLGMEISFCPLWASGGSSAQYWAPISHVVDRSDSTALTGYSLAERYDSHVRTAGQKGFKHIVQMNSTDGSGFIDIGSSSATAWIKLFSSGNSLSLTVGRMDVKYVVQFRGLGIN